MDLLLIGGLLLLLHRSTTQPAVVSTPAAPSSTAAPAPVTHILDLPPVNSVPAVVTMAAPKPNPVPVAAPKPAAPAPVVLPWDGGLYPSIPGAHLLLLPPMWNATSADAHIQAQTGGAYKVITVGSQVVAVPTTATPAPIAATRRPTPTGAIYSGPQNPISLLGNQLFTGVWNSNPNAQSRYNNYIPDASIGG